MPGRVKYIPNVVMDLDINPTSFSKCSIQDCHKSLGDPGEKCIGSCIDEAQSTFAEGRSILEGPLIVNELCSWVKKMRPEDVLIQGGLP
uniref:Uncharacterized protein n=1 Tax=Lactuca sativa TaxID=4236 RepID=A0A9R1W825_LACSA|nr:hypothetical protein LSAT_V11C300139180 [Lactuca sativa]